ncbi:MAG: DUF5591 domain-containing protein [Candidatus Hermodarchaeota archaeon]
MNYFYEILNKRIGYSRVGRIKLSKEPKKYLTTPNVILPMRNFLMKDVNFLEEFENHEIFLISKEVFLKIAFLRDKFRNTTFIFTHTGTLQTFVEILENNIDVFSEDNIILLIPFNIPTTILDEKFAKSEIVYYIESVKKLLEKFPGLNFGLSIKIFEHPQFLELYNTLIKENKNIKLLNLVDFFTAYTNYRNVLDLIINIKQNFDNNLVLMASGRIIPKFFPILIYLGIDLIDTSYLLYLTSENFYDTIEFLLPIYKVKYFPCSCVACQTKLKNFQSVKYSDEIFEYLSLHNLITAKTYMNKIKQYLRTEDFRAFVEKSSFDDVLIVSILKVLDRQYFDLIKYETPIADSYSAIKCFGPSSYFRPDFHQFRERLIKYFSPEPWTKLVVIFPCSARKPYSASKSHKKFHSVLRKFPDFPDFQEIILTSPLGAIPRQLENIYPVNSYDISVTGFWDNEEINLASQMLVDLLKKYNTKIPIICHVSDKGYKDIVLKAQKKLPNQFYFTEVYKNLTTSDSLESLENIIKNLKDNFKMNDKRPKSKYYLKSWVRKLVKIADYQFGSNIGMKIFSKGIRVKKSNVSTNLDIIDIESKKSLGKFLVKTGQIELSLNGAEILSAIDKEFNILVFNGDKINGNTLFRPGIVEFSQNLIPNNYVIILDKNKKNVIGLAKLIVGSNYIKNSENGRIAKIYEKTS